jgi:drug/metabolite transporter (DMT)-like permease
MIPMWMLFAFGAMFGWGMGQGFTKKFINDVSGTKFCLYFVFAVAALNIPLWIRAGAPNPIYTDTGDIAWAFLFWGTFSYVLDGMAWAAYFICIKYAPISIVGTVAAAYPAIMMVVLYFWLDENPTYVQWAGGITVVLGCIGLGYTPKSAVDETIDTSHVVPQYWIPLAILAAFGWGFAFSCLAYTMKSGLPGATESKQFVLMVLGDGLVMVPFALYFGRKTDTHSWSGIKLAAIPMAFFALGNICMPQAMAADTQKQFGGIIGAISAAYPMVTLTFAYIFLKERIIAFHWCAIAVVLGGIVACSGIF